jgi:hypothetical protein
MITDLDTFGCWRDFGDWVIVFSRYTLTGLLSSHQTPPIFMGDLGKRCLAGFAIESEPCLH